MVVGQFSFLSVPCFTCNLYKKHTNQNIRQYYSIWEPTDSIISL